MAEERVGVMGDVPREVSEELEQSDVDGALAASEEDQEQQQESPESVLSAEGSVEGFVKPIEKVESVKRILDSKSARKIVDRYNANCEVVRNKRYSKQIEMELLRKQYQQLKEELDAERKRLTRVSGKLKASRRQQRTDVFSALDEVHSWQVETMRYWEERKRLDDLIDQYGAVDKDPSQFNALQFESEPLGGMPNIEIDPSIELFQLKYAAAAREDFAKISNAGLWFVYQ